MAVVVRTSAVGTFDYTTNTISFTVPGTVLIGDVLVAFLFAQTAWGGSVTAGHSIAVAPPLWYDAADPNQAPAMSNCWWADSTGNTAFPGWADTLQHNSQTAPFAVPFDAAALQYPVASWVAMARVIGAFTPLSYSFRVMGVVPPDDGTHVYSGIILALSPYVLFEGAYLLPSNLQYAYDDLWYRTDGGHMRFTNRQAGLGMATATTLNGGAAPAIDIKDLWLQLLLYQGDSTYGPNSSLDTFEGFTYESGAVDVDGAPTIPSALTSRLNSRSQTGTFVTRRQISTGNIRTLEGTPVIYNLVSTPPFLPTPGGGPGPASWWHLPMRASECKVLRWTTRAADTGQPESIFGVSNPDAYGPIGWWLTGYDDSAWTTPVYVPANTPYADTSGGSHVSFDGTPDPIPMSDDTWWVTNSETDPCARVLTRWRFTVPAEMDAAYVAMIFNWNTNTLYHPWNVGYLNMVNPDDPVFLLGGAVFSAQIGDFYGLGPLIPGQENLLCLTSANPFGYPGPCGPGAQPWVQNTIIGWKEGLTSGNGYNSYGIASGIRFQFAPAVVTMGRSLAQIVG